MAEVTRVGVDETSAKRGQDYVSLFVTAPWRGSPPTLWPMVGTRSGSVMCRPT